MTTEPKFIDMLEDVFVRCRNLEAPLADRLQAFANELRRLGPQFQAAVDALVSRLAEGNVGANAPKVGEPMPAFLLPDEQGRLIRLEDLLGEGPVRARRRRWCLISMVRCDHGISEAGSEASALGSMRHGGA